MNPTLVHKLVINKSITYLVLKLRLIFLCQGVEPRARHVTCAGAIDQPRTKSTYVRSRYDTYRFFLLGFLIQWFNCNNVLFYFVFYIFNKPSNEFNFKSKLGIFFCENRSTSKMGSIIRYLCVIAK